MNLVDRRWRLWAYGPAKTSLSKVMEAGLKGAICRHLCGAIRLFLGAVPDNRD